MELVQTEFREGQLTEEGTWQAVVVISMGGKDYCDIGLVEVMCKLVTAILNFGLTASITFHEFLHRFWSGYSTGTATLKAKLFQ